LKAELLVVVLTTIALLTRSVIVAAPAGSADANMSAVAASAAITSLTVFRTE
jgi:hypothetical protein